MLPASTLTNVGMTANARTLEHAISKLLSANLQEERDLGLEIREQGRTTTPTLIKYAEASKHLKRSHPEPPSPPVDENKFQPSMDATLVEWEMAAEEKLVAALLYRSMGLDYGTARRRASHAGPEEHQRIIEDAMASMGPHDSPPREFETVSYTFEFLMDYGALREFRRHRMQTCIFQTPHRQARGPDPGTDHPSRAGRSRSWKPPAPQREPSTGSRNATPRPPSTS